MKGNDNLMRMKKGTIIRFRIGRANQCLGDAEAFAQAGSWNGTVNRLYFACFYSVAALVARDSTSTTEHGDIKRSVNQYDMRSGRMSDDLRVFYDELSALRLDADYEDFVVFDEEKVRPLIDEARQFVARVGELLSAK
ncbi:MAG: HEPN domain-containing protein [Thermomicrobiales bacterium]